MTATAEFTRIGKPKKLLDAENPEHGAKLVHIALNKEFTPDYIADWSKHLELQAGFVDELVTNMPGYHKQLIKFLDQLTVGIEFNDYIPERFERDNKDFTMTLRMQIHHYARIAAMVLSEPGMTDALQKCGEGETLEKITERFKKFTNGYYVDYMNQRLAEHEKQRLGRLSLEQH